MVTREVWRQALKQDVSGVSTDVLLCTVTPWCITTGYLAGERRGPFMAKLRSFAIRAEAEATCKWEDGRRPIRKAPVPATSDTLRGERHLTPGSGR